MDKISIVINVKKLTDAHSEYNKELDDWIEGEEFTYNSLSAEIHINGQKIKKEVDLFSLFFNDLDYRYDDRSQDNSSRFYPFNCSCGIPGCAGIWNGILPKFRKKSVEWRISDSRDGYGFLDKRFYSFSREQYEQELKSAWKIINNLEKAELELECNELESEAGQFIATCHEYYADRIGRLEA